MCDDLQHRDRPVGRGPASQGTPAADGSSPLLIAVRSSQPIAESASVTVHAGVTDSRHPCNHMTQPPPWSRSVPKPVLNRR